MKKILVLFAVLFVFVMQIEAQEYMIIEKTDGSSLKLNIEEIKQMFFNDEINPYFGQVAEPVDLGLSVDWASWDVGASKIGEYGGLYGWADPTGTLTSTVLSDYPSNNPPANICGTDYDIAHVVWGSDWRLPTYEEISELKERCTWYRYFLNGDSCIQVVGPSGNYIILPFAGCRYGTEIQDRAKYGYYWSGTLQSDDNKWGHGIFVNRDKYGLTTLSRLWGFSVRPVRPRVGNPIVYTTVVDFYDTKTSWDGNSRYRITGVIQEIYDTSINSFSLRDFSGDVIVNADFKLNSEGLKAGDIVTVVGTPANVSKYKDSSPLTGSPFGMHAEKLESVCHVTKVSIADFLKKEDSKDVYYMVTGTVDEIANTTYGNLYLKEGDDYLYVYGCYPGYGATGDNRKNFLATEGIEVGDELTMIGYKDTYKGTVELSGGIFYSHKKKTEAQLSVSPESITLGNAKGSHTTISIASNVDWTIASVPSWLSLSQSTGSGTTTITLTAKEQYEGASNRPYETMTISSTTSGKIAYVKVSQEGRGQFFDVTGVPVNLKSNAGATSAFTINTNISFTISTTADWLEVTPKSGNTTTTITVKAKTENTATSARSGSITIVNALIGKYTVDVSQDGGIATIIYKEPYTTWGATKIQVKRFMVDYTLYSEEDNMLAYLGNDQETLIMYAFQNSKLAYVGVVVENTKTTLNAIDRQLRGNGYYSVGNNVYESSDKKTRVSIEEDASNGVFFIYYIENNADPTTNSYFEEPYLKWGNSKSTVKTAMSNRNYTILGESNQASDYYYVAYKGKYKEQYSVYYFDSSIKLEEVSFTFLASDVSVNEMRNYLSSNLGYTYKGTNSQKDQFFYLLADGLSYAIVRSSTSNNGTVLTLVTFVPKEAISSGVRRSTNERIDWTDLIDLHDPIDMKLPDNKRGKCLQIMRMLKTD